MKLPRFENCRDACGFSLVETLVTLAIFSVITIGVFSAFDLQVKSTSRESSTGQSEIEFNVAKGLLERDLGMAGYGLADNYGNFSGSFDPLPYKGVNAIDRTGDSDFDYSGDDELLLMGTALGINSRSTQGWTYLEAIDLSAPSISYASWSDAREDLVSGDRILLMEPSTKTLLSQKNGTTDYWLFEYKGDSAFPEIAHSDASSATLSLTNRHLAYGLYGSSSSADDDDAALKPYHTVSYHLGGSALQYCADGTNSLLRVESRKTETPTGGTPLLNCVLDFQVAFGLDRDEDGAIDEWDDGGASFLNGYTRENQRKRLKQARVYVLVQSGRRDPGYTYPKSSIRVGEILTVDGTTQTTGRELTLDAEKRRYRWKLLALNLTPRNLR